MAPETGTMTPEEAAATIADVGTYRQGLTGRAAGIVWIIWGMCLAAVAGAETASGVGQDDLAGWSWLDGPMMAIYPLLILGIGVVATNAVWRAQALERGARHQSWIAWAALIGGLLVSALGVLAIIEGLAGTWAPDAAAGEVSYRTGLPAFAAIAAVTITVLQRHRVAWWPGAVAVLMMFVVQVLLPWVDGSGEVVVRYAEAVRFTGLMALLTFTGVGLIHYRRG